MSSTPETALERDRRLVAAAGAGDERAFEELYETYKGWVYRLALRVSGRHADALDVVQEAFLYLHAKLPGLVLRGRLTTLLYPAVRHLAAAARRRAGRYASDEAALAVAPAPELVEDARVALLGALHGVPGPQREVLLMRFSDGMSLEEVAVALGVPVGTVKSRLHHALGFLRTDKRTRAYFGLEARRP